MPSGIANPPDIDKIIALTAEQRSYIAGFFDGEGYVSLQATPRTKTRKDYVRVMIGVAQKRGPVLMWLHETFGGSLSIKIAKDHDLGGTLSVWSTSGRDNVKLFYRTVRSYLRLKGEEFDMAIAVMDNPDVTFEEAQTVADNIRKLRAVGE